MPSQGFNAGFARGLAGILGQQRVNDQQTARDTENRQNRLQDILLQTALERADDPNDALAFVQQQFPQMFKGSEGKVATAILQRTLPQAAAQALGQGGGGSTQASAQPSTPVPGGAPPVGAVGTPMPAATPATAPLAATNPLSRSGMILRDAATKDAAVDASFNAVVARLQRQGIALTPDETKQVAVNGQIATPYRGAAGIGTVQSIAGELPDGTPVMGILDKRPGSPSYGKIVDPDTYEPIPDFRPRTSTGSRTLGSAIEAGALELYGIQAHRLTSEQMAAVQQLVRERAVTLAKEKGLATGEAKNTTTMAAPLTVDNAAQLQVGVGTTMNDVVGQTPMTPKQQETRQALNSLQTKLPALQALVREVIPDYGPGIINRARAAGEMKYMQAAGDPKFTALKAMAKSMSGEISRALQGQTGVLSDQDTQRANDLIVNVDSYFPDTGPMATEKINVIIDLMAAINAAIPNPQATGRVAAPTATAPKPAATTPAAGTRPRVSNAAPAAQKVGNAWVIP